MIIREDDQQLPSFFPFWGGNVEIPQTSSKYMYHWHDCFEITCIHNGLARYYVNGRAGLCDYEYLRPFAERGSRTQNRLPHDDQRARYHRSCGRSLQEILLPRGGTPADDKGANPPNPDAASSLLPRREPAAIAFIGSKKDLRHISSAFLKRTVGCTFVEYIMRTRVLKAKELLATTDGRGIDIACECGFNSVSYFYRGYRSFFGAPPRDARREYLPEDR